MIAVNTGITYVGSTGQATGCSCPCPGSVEVFRSVWDRLCQQLFGATPPSIDTEDVLPDIDIWKGGVVMVDDGNYPYTFVVMCEGSDTPKPSDVIQYKGKFYIIGEVIN